MGLLTVAAGETAASLTVTATSTHDNTKKGTAEVTVIAPAVPAIISVEVEPDAVSVPKGQQRQFTAIVVTQGDASTSVAWSLSGNTSLGTTISSSGLLYISTYETASTFTVTATSDFDRTKTGTATVTVYEPPAVLSIYVEPYEPKVPQGQTQLFTATVTVSGGASKEVIWTVSNNSSPETGINSNGLFKMGNNEKNNVVVRATSTFDPSMTFFQIALMVESGTVTVSGNVAGVPAETPVQLLSAEDGTTKSGLSEGYTYVATTTTDANGYYCFNNLPPGVYIVLVIMDGYESTPSNPMTLTDGETASNVNFTVKGGVITPDGLTGAGELFAPDLKIYPNPFTDAVRITGAEGCALRVMNAAGVTVHIRIIANPDETLRLEHLSSGVYLFCLEKDGRMKTFKTIRE